MTTTPPKGVDTDTGEVLPKPSDAKRERTPADNANREAGLVRRDQPGTDVEVHATTPELTRYLSSSAAVAEEDPEQVAFEIVQRILAATNVDEVLARRQVLSADDVLQIPITVTAVRWHRSAYDQRERMYAMVEASRTDNREPLLISCGGRNVMAQLWRLGELDAFPCALKFGKSEKPTANGYFPLWLEPATTL
jgi:hypothetical protein